MKPTDYVSNRLCLDKEHYLMTDYVYNRLCLTKTISKSNWRSSRYVRCLRLTDYVCNRLNLNRPTSKSSWLSNRYVRRLKLIDYTCNRLSLTKKHQQLQLFVQYVRPTLESHKNAQVLIYTIYGQTCCNFEICCRHLKLLSQTNHKKKQTQKTDVQWPAR